jgi:hypothetical protein
MFTSIIKRDGRTQAFHESKITDAIFKCLEASEEADRQLAVELTLEVIKKIKQQYKEDNYTVENVQDLVETVLIERGRAKVAKSYILYRENRSRLREARSEMMNAVSEILHHCPYCHNLQSWDANGGKEFTVRQIIRLVKKQKKTKQGITLSGGEPFIQASELAELALAAHQAGLDVVTYTGYTYEQLIEEPSDGIKALLAASDILIDGKYIHELRSVSLQFRGSSNQRIIDLAETHKKGQIVLWS